MPSSERLCRPKHLWVGRGLVVIVILVVAATLVVTGPGVSERDLSGMWQLIDLRVLGDDPLGSLWYLHSQPPAHNLVVGVVTWLPIPIGSTLFLLYSITLVATGLLLHDLLVRWGIGPLAAAAITSFGLASPDLLDTIRTGGYEVPACMLIVAGLSCAQRHLEAGGIRWLLMTAAALSAGALTRTLLHPAWVAGVLSLLLVARPMPWRQAAAVVAVPTLLLGGWAAKNELLFGTPTLSSWTGFNMQRGIVAPMEEGEVRAAVSEGVVSPLALRYPWGTLDDYRRWTAGCAPRHHHPAVSQADKPTGPGRSIANFNHECYLRLYRQARHDAIELVIRYPGRYLTTRASGLVASYGTGAGCRYGTCTWMHVLYQPLLLGVEAHVGMADWNLPLLRSGEGLDFEVSLLLLAASVWLAVRGGMAAYRLARIGWRHRHEWPTDELSWLIGAWTVAIVVGGGDVVEFGENARFRTMVDPLLLTLPLASLVRIVRTRKARA
jgi:hypothetical protein